MFCKCKKKEHMIQNGILVRQPKKDSVKSNNKKTNNLKQLDKYDRKTNIKSNKNIHYFNDHYT
jgi:hypothetical protein